MGLTQGACGFGNGHTNSSGQGSGALNHCYFCTRGEKGGLWLIQAAQQQDAPRTSAPPCSDCAVSCCGIPRVALLEKERLQPASLGGLCVLGAGGGNYFGGNTCTFPTSIACLTWVPVWSPLLWEAGSMFWFLDEDVS